MGQRTLLALSNAFASPDLDRPFVVIGLRR